MAVYESPITISAGAVIPFPRARDAIARQYQRDVISGERRGAQLLLIFLGIVCVASIGAVVWVALQNN